MVLGEVEESVTSREIDEETEEEIVKVSFWLSLFVCPLSASHLTHIAGLFHHPQTSKRNIEMLFVRGDIVILVSPPLRTS